MYSPFQDFFADRIYAAYFGSKKKALHDKTVIKRAHAGTCTHARTYARTRTRSLARTHARAHTHTHTLAHIRTS